MSEVKQFSLTIKLRFGLLLLAASLVGLDQWTKYLARHILSVFEVKRFLPLWDWTLVYNQGAAFSFLAQQGGWQRIFFVAISAIVSLFLLYYLLRNNYSRIAGIAFSLILGGAVGNLIDRALVGRVTDFIAWHVGEHYWPAFNVADSCVSIGVALLLIENIFWAKK